ncbi:phosphodiester glycosidase family protein [Streptomyces roseolus]|uniref:phosphodiester glycosidase family protein n=1 Tax=Streptomyces roseolus TaxID=67358 RepID=UPI00167BE34C|nr:phosphodiester glycosidase family protein [Streptomyces roseolus]GGR46658.1 hypothetical protein GCM10010282_44410 [Streptomyces roseolus]
MRSRTPASLALCLLLALPGCSAAPTDRKAPAPHPSATAGTPLPEGVGYREFEHGFGPGETSHVRVVSVRPDARARVAGAHGPALARTRTVRETAVAGGAVAAVNGGFFDVHTGRHHGGYEGDAIGLYVEGGRLLSEATNGRAALLLGHEAGRMSARIEEVSVRGRLRTDDNATRELDGVNRLPGRVLGCGGVGGDRVADTEEFMEAPYGGLCTDASEIVSFTPEWGERTPAGPPGSAEAVLDRDGRVIEVRRPAGGPVPEDGTTLYGIGSAAGWLREHAPRGSGVLRSVRLWDEAGRPVEGRVDTAVGGSHRLLRDGRVTVGPTAARGIRAPRTLAGVTADGTLLLVTVDGRKPGVDSGATVQEAARLMASLGATAAVNLDGGGSTTMVVGGVVRNTPRGVDGSEGVERPVADVLAVYPR